MSSGYASPMAKLMGRKQPNKKSDTPGCVDSPYSMNYNWHPDAFEVVANKTAKLPAYSHRKKSFSSKNGARKEDSPATGPREIDAGSNKSLRKIRKLAPEKSTLSTDSNGLTKENVNASLNTINLSNINDRTLQKYMGLKDVANMSPVSADEVSRNLKILLCIQQEQIHEEQQDDFCAAEIEGRRVLIRNERVIRRRYYDWLATVSSTCYLKEEAMGEEIQGREQIILTESATFKHVVQELQLQKMQMAHRVSIVFEEQREFTRLSVLLCVPGIKFDATMPMTANQIYHIPYRSRCSDRDSQSFEVCRREASVRVIVQSKIQAFLSFLYTSVRLLTEESFGRFKMTTEEFFIRCRIFELHMRLSERSTRIRSLCAEESLGRNSIVLRCSEQWSRWISFADLERTERRQREEIYSHESVERLKRESGLRVMYVHLSELLNVHSSFYLDEQRGRAMLEALQEMGGNRIALAALGLSERHARSKITSEEEQLFARATKASRKARRQLIHLQELRELEFLRRSNIHSSCFDALFTLQRIHWAALQEECREFIEEQEERLRVTIELLLFNDVNESSQKQQLGDEESTARHGVEERERNERGELSNLRIFSDKLESLSKSEAKIRPQLMEDESWDWGLLSQWFFSRLQTLRNENSKLLLEGHRYKILFAQLGLVATDEEEGRLDVEDQEEDIRMQITMDFTLRSEYALRRHLYDIEVRTFKGLYISNTRFLECLIDRNRIMQEEYLGRVNLYGSTYVHLIDYEVKEFRPRIVGYGWTAGGAPAPYGGGALRAASVVHLKGSGK